MRGLFDAPEGPTLHCAADAQAPNSIGKIFKMNEEQQVELLSRVDIFESLEKDDVRQILRDLLQRNALRSTSEQEKSSTLHGNPTASSSSSSRGGYASTRWKPQESLPSKW
jgi:hypothetical protein